jgi:ankyrin repeat protein
MANEDEKAILRAAKKGNLAVVYELVSKDKALLCVRDSDGSTPLHCAAWKGHVEVVRALLDAGADMNDHNQNDHWGTTALHAAAHGNQKEVVALLIDRGANLNARNPSGRTPLDETLTHNATAAAKLIKEAIGK